MISKYRLIFIAPALLHFIVFFTFPLKVESNDELPQHPEDQRALKSENIIQGVRVIRKDGRSLMVEVDYFYNGIGRPSTGLFLSAYDKSDKSYIKANDYWDYRKGRYVKAQQGKNTATLKFNRLYINPRSTDGTLISTHIRIRMGRFINDQPDLEKELPLFITWFPYDPIIPEGVTKDNIDELFNEAVKFIDKSGKKSRKLKTKLLSDAKRILDEIMIFNPRYLNIYPELARYEMKSRWNKQSITRAERVLLSALKINPSHTNSLVLLGYVYTKQGRYSEGLSKFETAKQLGTKNLWLYSNWAENLFLQGETQKAIKMYELGISKPRAFNSHDRAKMTAYQRLISIYTDSNKLDKVDILYKKILKEFPEDSCSPVEYAEFMLGYQGGTLDSTLLAEKGLVMRCLKNYTNKVIAATYLSRLGSATKMGVEVDETLFIRSQALFPNSSKMLAYLAEREKTSEIINVLIDQGINIDARDSQDKTALIHAITARNIDAVSRLLAANADINITIGEQRTTPLMIAAMSSTISIVKLLLDSGANINSQDAFQLTAEDWAQRTGKIKTYRMLSKRNGA